MPSFTSSGGQLSIELQGVTSPQIDNVSLLNPNTEYSISLPANVKKFLIRARNSGSLKFRYQSGADFLTISPGCFYSEDSLDVPSLTIYIESSSAAQVAEIVTWT